MFTIDDLNAVEQAILNLQTGRRVTSVTYGDTNIQYASMSLADLLRLRSQIKNTLNEGERGKKRQVVFVTSKGLT